MFQPSMTHGHNDQAKRLQEGAEECLKFPHTANKLPQKRGVLWLAWNQGPGTKEALEDRWQRLVASR